MRKKLLGVFVGVLLASILLTGTALAGSEWFPTTMAAMHKAGK